MRMNNLLCIIFLCGIAAAQLSRSRATGGISTRALRERTVETLLSQVHELEGVSRLRQEKDAFLDPHIPGWEITSHQQYVSDLPVIGADIKVVWNDQNEIVSVTGITVPDADIAVRAANKADILSIDDAVAAAMQYSPCSADGAKLVVFRVGLKEDLPGTSRIAWEVPCTNDLAYVDATSGAVLAARHLEFGLIRAVDERNMTIMWRDGDPLPSGDAEVNSFVTAMIYANKIWSAYTGYNSFDNKGTTITGYMYSVRPGSPLYRGDTNIIFVPRGMAANTIMWHEWGHAITVNIDNPWYEAQSGALCEAFSDSWAMTLDNIRTNQSGRPYGQCSGALGTTQRWIAGYDCTDPTSRCTKKNADGVTIHGSRDLWEPRCISAYPGSVAGMYCQADDMAGVHWSYESTHSIIPSRTYAFLVDGVPGKVEAIGIDAAFQIFLRAKFLCTQMTTFERYASNLLLACEQLVGQTLRDHSGNLTVKITANTCTQLAASIALVGLNATTPCASATPTFAAQSEPFKVMIYGNQTDIFSFVAAGNVTAARLTIKGVQYPCTPMALRQSHYWPANDSNSVWRWWVSCPTPNPLNVGIGPHVNTSITASITANGTTWFSKTFATAYWRPLVSISSVSWKNPVPPTGTTASISGANFFDTSASLTCGLYWPCAFCCVCSQPIAEPIYDQTGICNCDYIRYRNSSNALFPSSGTLDSMDRGRYYIQCTVHGERHYGPYFTHELRNQPSDVVVCVADAASPMVAVSGATVTAAENVYGSTSATTTAQGCTTLSLERDVQYIVTAAAPSYQNAVVNVTLPHSGTVTISLSKLFASNSVVQHESSTPVLPGGSDTRSAASFCCTPAAVATFQLLAHLLLAHCC